ncbi:MAG: hypothetical protein SVN78_06630 [Deferribacterota bacterium]|nr:hypothetical protein [Deferribacterota bacterium]
MKIKNLFYTFLVVAISVVVISCERPSEEEKVTPKQESAEEQVKETPVVDQVKEKGEDIYSEIKKSTFDKKEDFIDWLNKKSDGINKKLAKVEKKFSEADEQAKEQYRATIEYLKEKKAQLDESIENLKSETEENWETAKENIANILDDIDQAFKDFEE